MKDPVHQKRLVHGARFRYLPMNVPCRARCAFCYERRMKEILPHVTTECVPPYDEARFDEFLEMHRTCLDWEAETGRDPLFGVLPAFELSPRGVAHFPHCDLFLTGLTHAQIEELVRLREGDVFLAYTVGLSMDPEFVAYLTVKYPETFRLHLSIVTFDPEIRGHLMHPDIDVEALRRVSALARNATFFFLLFTEEQLRSDVEEILATTAPANGGLFLHKLYHHGASPRRVVEYAAAADRHREAAVRAVAALPRDGRGIMCSLGADIQAFTRRKEIQPLFEACRGRSDEAVFCAPGAFPTIREMFHGSDTAVIPMDSAFGGDVDFVQGTTARGVIAALRKLPPLRRIFLPDAMFWIDGGYDLFGDTADVIRCAFPDLAVEVLPIPPEIIFSVIDIDDCLAWFDRRGA